MWDDINTEQLHEINERAGEGSVNKINASPNRIGAIFFYHIYILVCINPDLNLNAFVCLYEYPYMVVIKTMQ